jgi:type III secretion protein R
VTAFLLATTDIGFAAKPVSMLGLLLVLSLIPFAVVALSSFSKVAVVLSIARTAIGSQHAPPNLVITALAAVLSLHIMSPVIEASYERISSASLKFEVSPRAASDLKRVAEPFHSFLMKHGSPEERSRFVEWSRELRGEDDANRVHETDLAIVVPAFVVTELKEAFQLGFLVLLPFLVVDMLVANVLLALGMQTLSPTQVSLPFKLLLFVSVDGWSLLSRGLVLGYR